MEVIDDAGHGRVVAFAYEEDAVGEVAAADIDRTGRRVRAVFRSARQSGCRSCCEQIQGHGRLLEGEVYLVLVCQERCVHIQQVVGVVQRPVDFFVVRVVGQHAVGDAFIVVIVVVERQRLGQLDAGDVDIVVHGDLDGRRDRRRGRGGGGEGGRTGREGRNPARAVAVAFDVGDGRVAACPRDDLRGVGGRDGGGDGVGAAFGVDGSVGRGEGDARRSCAVTFCRRFRLAVCKIDRLPCAAVRLAGVVDAIAGKVFRGELDARQRVDSAQYRLRWQAAVSGAGERRLPGAFIERQGRGVGGGQERVACNALGRRPAGGRYRTLPDNVVAFGYRRRIECRFRCVVVHHNAVDQFDGGGIHEKIDVERTGIILMISAGRFNERAGYERAGYDIV